MKRFPLQKSRTWARVVLKSDNAEGRAFIALLVGRG
jgi:hypothetical protein